MNVEEFWKVFTVSKLITALTGRNINQMIISHFWKTITDHCTLLGIQLIYTPIYLFINVIFTYISFTNVIILVIEFFIWQLLIFDISQTYVNNQMAKNFS